MRPGALTLTLDLRNMDETSEKKFEPLTRNRWIVELPSIDPFLVKTVRPPILKPGLPGEMAIELYTVYDHGEQNRDLKRLLDSQELQKGIVKFLNPVGIVDEVWSFTGRLSGMTFSVLDYGSFEPLTTYLTFTLTKFKIKKWKRS